MFSNLNTLDLILISIISISCLFGYFKGIAKQLIYTISWLVAIYFSHLYGQEVGQMLPIYFPVPFAQMLAGYIVVFLGVMIAGRLLGLLMTSIVNFAGLKLFNQFIGLLYGLLRGMVLSMLIVQGAMALPNKHHQNLTIEESLIAPYLIETSTWLKDAIDIKSLMNQ